MVTLNHKFKELNFSIDAPKDARRRYNDYLRLSDALNCLTIQAKQNTPPSTPLTGQAWLVGASPTGDWSGESEDTVALYLQEVEGDTAAPEGWSFVAPFVGLEIWYVPTPDLLTWNGTIFTPSLASSAGVQAGLPRIDFQALQAIATVENFEILEMDLEADGTQWTVDGTAANSVDAIDSDNDAKYMSETTLSETHRYYNAQPVSMESGDTIDEVYVLVRAWYGSGSGDQFRVGLRIPANNEFIAQAIDGTPTDYQVGPFNRPGGGSWTFSDFDTTSRDLRTLINHNGSTGDQIRVSRLRLKVFYTPA